MGIRVMREDTTSSENDRTGAADDDDVTAKAENASNHPEKSGDIFSVCTVETASDDNSYMSEEETSDASKAVPNRHHKEAEKQHDSDTGSECKVEYFTDDEDIELTDDLSYSCPS